MQQSLALVLVAAVFRNGFAALDSCPNVTIKKLEDRCRACMSKSLRGVETGASLTTCSPPLLVSHAGAGNTMARVLLEYASGYRSGSMYNDTTLFRSLPGEADCPINSLIVKTHLYGQPVPRNRSYIERIEQMYSLAEVRSTRAKVLKCRREVQQHLKQCSGNPQAATVSAAIFLYRNPFEAFWSDYQRVYAHRVAQQSGKAEHTFKVDPAQVANSHHFIGWMSSYSRLLLQNWKWAKMMHDTPGFDLLLVDYADLVSDTSKVESLQQMLEFVVGGAGAVDEQRLRCAFDHANAQSSGIHRATSRADKVTALDQVFSAAVVNKMWNSYGLKYSWAIARDLGVQWRMSIAGVENKLSNATILASLFKPAL